MNIKLFFKALAFMLIIAAICACYGAVLYAAVCDGFTVLNTIAVCISSLAMLSVSITFAWFISKEDTDEDDE